MRESFWCTLDRSLTLGLSIYAPPRIMPDTPLAENVDIPDIDDDIFVHDLSHAMQFFAASQTNNKIFKRVAK